MAESSERETLLAFAAEPFEVFYDRQHPRLRDMAVASDRRFDPIALLRCFTRHVRGGRRNRDQPVRALLEASREKRSSMTSCSVIPPHPCAAVFRSSRAPSEERTICTYHFAQVARSTKSVPATFDRLAPPLSGRRCYHLRTPAGYRSVQGGYRPLLPGAQRARRRCSKSGSTASPKNWRHTIAFTPIALPRPLRSIRSSTSPATGWTTGLF